MVKIRSRIHEFFTPNLLRDLYKICRNSVISDNNLKADAVLQTLNDYKLEYVELGTGTNRMAILIDNYVFKIALDKWGLQDNLNEFTVSEELQPYVVKTYETNELLSVCEYVTVISKEEFDDNKEVMRDILAVLAESYLLGDVGTVSKNFANWGYRDNGDMVILDFAYIYRVQGDELLCSKDQSILEYDEDFHTLYCPSCRKKYTFMDVRRKITMEQEKHENTIAKQFAYVATKPLQEVKDRYLDEGESEDSSDSLYINNSKTNAKEEQPMRREEDYELTEEEEQDSYLRTLELLKSGKTDLTSPAEESSEDPYQLEPIDKDDIAGAEDFTSSSLIQVQRETPTEKSSIRIYTQSKGDTDGDVPVEVSVLEGVKEALAEAVEDVDHATEAVVETSDRVEKLIEEEGDNANIKVTFSGLEEQEEEEETPPTLVHVTEISTQDVDNDGKDEVVIDTETYAVVTPSTIVTDDEEDVVEEEPTSEIANAILQSIMDNDQDVPEMGEFGQPDELVYTNNVQLTDSINIESTIKVNVSGDTADKLRQELMAGVEEDEDGVDEERVAELAQEYTHLQDEVDQYDIESRHRGSNKNWR